MSVLNTFTLAATWGAHIDLKPCCEETVRIFSPLNDMMVCHTCTQKIKSFREEVNFKRYVEFCATKKRPIEKSRFETLYLVLFS